MTRLLLPIGILCLLAGCSGGAARSDSAVAGEGGAEAVPTTDQPSFVIWMVDTLRADALGCYGNPEARTPYIDAFAASGTVYEHVASAASYTRASVASLLTGLPVTLHGTRSREDTLRSDLPLLTERLRAAGYDTAAVVTNPNVGSAFGFDRGWDHFQQLYRRREPGSVHPDELIATGREVAQHALAWISSRPPDRPFFLFALSAEPHAPYTPPPDYAALHDVAAHSWMDGTLDALRRLDREPARRSPEILQRMRSLYDAEVSYADEAFGLFLDGLESAGVGGRTLIAFTSDHGEEFYEHGRRDHGRTVYEESVRVPLIVRDPLAPVRGRREAAPRSLMDLAATILVRSGADPAPGGWGVPLDETSRPEASPVLSEQVQRGALTALRDGPLKIIRDEETGEERVFHLGEDPGERRPLPAVDLRVATMASRLADARARIEAARPALGRVVTDEEIPEEDLEALRALGYVQ